MNKLYCGDNLKIMEGMADESVDLIATDPPFNTGKDWGQFNDKWEDGLKGYLKFMQPRIEQMHRLLKDTGSLYLHCDPTASHYLKVMLDTIFGIKQFRNEIVWHYTTGAPNCNQFPRRHDTIYWYSKSDKWVFNKDSIRVPYNSKTIERHKYRVISYGQECSLNPLGQVPNTVWDIPFVKKRKERTGYPTQKPLKLYERIIQASSNWGDIILDLFCGSGTTLVAANSLSRYYIGIDQNPEAIRISQERLKQLNLFTEG